MEYQVSARKYRPMTFASVVGQETLTTTLKNAIKSGKLAHAFLFCGPRGVGKTTCARIFAKTINCLSPMEDGEACGECESCKAFAEQRSYNIFELDGASNNGVEHIKQLMEQTRIKPQIGKYKVFIIDEVHMLSSAAFNAFLKTLEEPPSYVIFIMATTEKQKLLPTIISRCQIYDFDRMTVDNTINHLKMVAEKEGISYEDEALEVIAEKADGGMRDALSIFDQAASYCQGNITLQKVVEDLNLLDIENYFKFVDLCFNNKCSEVMLLLNRMLSNGTDGNIIINGLASHIRNIMMARDPQTVNLLQASQRYHERYIEQGKAVTPLFMFKALQILNRCDLNYRQSSNKRLLVEIALIEVAQITQPADEPSASPRRGKRLKSLFKNITLRQSKPAEQVAGTSSANQPENQAQQGGSVTAMPEMKGQPATSATPTSVEQKPQQDTQRSQQQPLATPVTRPRLKMKDIGTSFRVLLNEGKNEEEEVIEVTNKEENKPFTDDDLLFQWLAMCNRMKAPYIALASSMKLLEPKITDFPNAELVVTNSILLEQITAIRKRIEVTLAQGLHNGSLKLSLRLAEKSEIKHVLTKREVLEKIKKQKPEIGKLIEDFEFDLIL